MRETFLWFGVYCAWALVFFAVIWPWLQGRIPSDQYHAYLRSPEWAEKVSRLASRRRGQRCAACSGTSDLNVHHVFYTSLGHEPLWHLVRLCSRHHEVTHNVSRWVFSSHTRGLWLSTPLVIVCTRLARLGGRQPDLRAARNRR